MKLKIEIVRGDITELNVDAIVNAANRSLLGGGGVDGAIHRAAGSELLEACRNLNGCDTGMAKITPGFHLLTRFIIHAVGPVWRGGSSGEEALLESCYLKSLELAQSQLVKTIAFPNISTGVYRFPKPLAAKIAIATTKGFLSQETSIEKVYFVCFDEENYQLYEELLDT